MNTKKVNDNYYYIIHLKKIIGYIEITKLNSGRVYGDRRMRNVYFNGKYLGVADTLKEALGWVKELNEKERL